MTHAKQKKIRRRQILAGLICANTCDDKLSAAEEQPQQKDHRYRHAQQPEQKSSSHFSLHENLTDSRTPKGRSGSSKRKKPRSNVRCSTLIAAAVEGPRVQGFGISESDNPI
jgi:hypothetical protein